MLTFYPDFELDSSDQKTTDVIILMDCSNSMKGEALEEAQALAMFALKDLPISARFNLVKFATGFEELFPRSQAKTEENYEKAVDFILVRLLLMFKNYIA